ncbi:hypothetical protein Nisw_01165 [Candidatus Nitrosopumilus sp. SW]|uniref:hypothetical protein n=1 Tax=Candidatus Nitrosopumilus sp. SW TaxID=2508726 RepID=UPI001153759A|nr:hypothetical protein [Candidatus Nitrosopumilus sp. SW]QDI88238.1 hypothetical protein Nisw_01165 [Candidatus Nitrosopumilus sp. SW]
MIHPTITEIFSDDSKANLFFKWISNQIKERKKMQEFLHWHVEVISEVISEVNKTQKIDFFEKNETEQWAKDFLKNYDEKIRKMRNISNQIFERFHELKTEFKEIIPKDHKYEKESNETMQIFLNKHELLVGKIIFSYRELWFLANHITDSNFKLGSIKKYQEWVDENYTNLKNVKKELKNIEKEIS